VPLLAKAKQRSSFEAQADPSQPLGTGDQHRLPDVPPELGDEIEEEA
jgi:hypothetical protein